MFCRYLCETEVMNRSRLKYVRTYIRSYLLPAWSRVLEKLTGSQLVKKFPAFSGILRLITAFTDARHLSL
jgi:TorA maturation chaperone TorD